MRAFAFVGTQKEKIRTWPLLLSPLAYTGGRRNDLLPEKKELLMEKIATITLLLNLGIAAIHAQDRNVRMTFSGTIQATTLIAQPASNTDKESLEGHGTFEPTPIGNFTRIRQPPSLLLLAPARIRFTFRQWPAASYFVSMMEVY